MFLFYHLLTARHNSCILAKISMPLDLFAQAIKAALNSSWTEAIQLNELLLKENPDDVETLNRLGFAFRQAGQADQAMKTYRKVLKFDRFNPIARKNLKLLETMPKRKGQILKPNAQDCSLEMFVEEPGKTKLVNLVNLAPNSVLSSLSCGYSVSLTVKRRTILVTTQNKIYLGALPDDLSSRLIRLLGLGCRYNAFIKTVEPKNLSIFIRETFRSAKRTNQSSFPITNNHHSLAKEKTEPAEEEIVEEEAAPTESLSYLER